MHGVTRCCHPDSFLRWEPRLLLLHGVTRCCHPDSFLLWEPRLLLGVTYVAATRMPNSYVRRGDSCYCTVLDVTRCCHPDSFLRWESRLLLIITRCSTSRTLLPPFVGEDGRCRAGGVGEDVHGCDGVWKESGSHRLTDGSPERKRSVAFGGCLACRLNAV